MTKGNVIERIPVLSPYYILSFDIKPLAKTHGWSNIIHVTNRDNVGQYGDRTPAIFLFGSPTKWLLIIYSAINGKTPGWRYSLELPLKKFSNIRVEQQPSQGQAYYRIFINGQQTHSIENTDARSFKNVTVYAADIWYASAKAIVKNYQFLNARKLCYSSKKSVIIFLLHH